MTEWNQDDTMEQRIVALEESMMHTERLLESLNEAVCLVQDQLDEQTRAIGRLKQTVQSHVADDGERPGLEEERPPHY